jgi:4-hydroxy-tetrahydrodipicolinate reductase
VIEEHFPVKKRENQAPRLRSRKSSDLIRSAYNSIRVGGIVGKHEVVFGLQNQTIRITHDVISRGAFGAGSCLPRAR